VTHAQQVIDDLETLLATRIVDPADVHQLSELTIRVVAQKGQHADDRRTLHGNDQFAKRDPGRQNVVGQRRLDVIAQFLKRLIGHDPGLPVYRAMRLPRLIFF
jgi:hypothetical protein